MYAYVFFSDNEVLTGTVEENLPGGEHKSPHTELVLEPQTLV